MSPDAVRAWYARYLRACNDHRFGDLATLLHDVVTVNGLDVDRDTYVADLEAVVVAFPDYRWSLHQSVVEPPWLAVRLHGSGTHRGIWQGVPGTGRWVRTEAFAMYAVEESRYAALGLTLRQVRVTADDARSR